MTSKLVAVGGVTGAITLAMASPLWACGGGGVTTAQASQAGVVADAQRVVISVRAEGTPSVKTEIIAQIGVPKTSADYGVLIPTPVLPTLDPEPISSADLDELDRLTRPTIVRKVELPEADDDGGFGCGCVASGDAGDSLDTRGSPEAVQVGAPVKVGPVTAVVLHADDAVALMAWLDENGFAIPAEQAALVAKYVRPGGAFIAVRRNDQTATRAPSSVGLHYTLPGDYRLVSLAFARLGAAPTVAFTVFVGARYVMRASGVFTNLTLNDLDATLLATSYSKSVASAVANQRYAFVLEGVSYPSMWTTLSQHFTNLFDTGVLTRASTIMAADTLDTDASFDEPTTVQIPNSRTIGPVPLKRVSSVSALGLVYLARALRRRAAAHAARPRQ
jgi:hypothetical protein